MSFGVNKRTLMASAGGSDSPKDIVAGTAFTGDGTSLGGRNNYELEMYRRYAPRDPSDQRRATRSIWYKGFAGYRGVFSAMSVNGDTMNQGRVGPNGEWIWYLSQNMYDGTVDGTSGPSDKNVWQHIVWNWDTANSTNLEKLRYYWQGNKYRINERRGRNIGSGRTGPMWWGDRTRPDHSDSRIQGRIYRVSHHDGVSTYNGGHFGLNGTLGWVPQALSTDMLKVYNNNGFMQAFKDPLDIKKTEHGTSRFEYSNMNGWENDERAQYTDSPFNNMNTIDFNQSSGVTHQDHDYVQSTGNGRCISYYGVLRSKPRIWYWEFLNHGGDMTVGITAHRNSGEYPSTATYGYHSSGNKEVYGTRTKYGRAWDTNQTHIIGVQFDYQLLEMDFWVNGDHQGRAFYAGDIQAYDAYWPWVRYGASGRTLYGCLNFGAGSQFGWLRSRLSTTRYADVNGCGDFAYPPQGWSICAHNLHYA